MTTDKQRIHFGLEAAETHYMPPSTVTRRRAFFSGLKLATAQIKKFSNDERHKPKQFDCDVRHHGRERGPTKAAKRIESQMVFSRLTRKERNRLLRAKCRAAGVKSPMALALAK